MASNIHINDLPDVVLEYVFSQLSPYKELLNCRLVCKQWYHLTYSALHKIKLDFRIAIKNLNIEWNKYATINWPNISGRYSHSSCLHLQYMYIFGGCTTGSTTSNFRTQSNMCTTFNDLWVFDLNEKTWSRPLMSGHYPPPKACASMVSYKNKLFLFGGWTHCSAYPLNQDWKLFDELHEFDIEENKWTLIKSIFNSNFSSGLESSIADTASIPPAMAGHSASVIGNKMLIYGGLLYSQGSNFNPICINKDIYIYDFETNKWSKKEVINGDENPSPRYGHTQIVLDKNSLAIIGGCSSPKVLYNDIWILKMEKESWYWRKVTIEPNDAFNSQIFGFHQAVKVDDMIVFLSNICTNSNAAPLDPKNRKLFRSGENSNHQNNYANHSAFSLNNNGSNSHQNIQFNNYQFNNRLQAQPTQDQRRREFLASFNKLDNRQDKQINDPRQETNQELNKNKAIKSSIIKLQTIKIGHRPKPHNPMFLHVLDFSKVLTNFKASWVNQIRKFDGPDEIMLYSLVAATNELILFGGIEKVPLNHLNPNLSDRKLETVSNCVYIASPKNVVI